MVLCPVSVFVIGKKLYFISEMGLVDRLRGVSSKVGSVAESGRNVLDVVSCQRSRPIMPKKKRYAVT